MLGAIPSRRSGPSPEEAYARNIIHIILILTYLFHTSVPEVKIKIITSGVTFEALKRRYGEFVWKLTEGYVIVGVHRHRQVSTRS